MATGKRDLSAGVTLRTRVFEEGARVLEKCSGYDPSDGALRPDKLTARESNTALTGTMLEQTPFAFVQAAATKIIARDADTAFRELSAGTWSSAGSALEIVEENTPVRVREQIVYASDGVNPRLMVYEPASGSTKLRPLSLKSPADYASNTKPAITPSATAATQLFDNDDANVWAIADAAYGSVANSADKTTITLDSDAPADKLVAKKSLAAGTKSPTGKAFLVLDVMVQEDSEPYYPYFGLFANNDALLPSGYLFGLYSDTTCNNLIASYRIPACAEGAVNRVVINIGTQTTTVQGVGLLTDSFFTAPEGTEEYDISFYSEAWTDEWSSKGNWLMPAVKWDKSPFADVLTSLGAEAGEIELPPTNNALAALNPSFESAGTWTYGAGTYATRVAVLARTGSYSVRMRNDTGSPGGSTLTSAAFSVDAGSDYAPEFWYQIPFSNIRGHQLRVTITPDVGGATSFPGATTWTTLQPTYTYQQWTAQWTAPAGSSTATIEIKSKAEWFGHPQTYLYLDDVAVYRLDQATQGNAVVLQTFGEDTATDRTPEDPRVQWCYCFAGKDRLSAENWQLMISNPSDGSREVNFSYADPWRTYAVAVTLPNGPINTVAAAPTAGGTGYEVDDILTIDAGEGGRVKVLTLSGSAVATVELVKAGTGYATGSGQTTINETDNTGTGCTVNITDIITPIEEYGDYLTHILLYRRIYDGATGIWSSWQYVQAVTVAASMTWTDEGTDAEPVLFDRDIPEEVEVTNDYASSARYATYSGGRVYAACLDWDNEDAVWDRPTAIEVSGFEKSWSFPTTTDEDSLMTDGTELDGYAATGAEVRGILARGDERYVFLDNEFFLLRGDNPQNWYFTRLDSVGLQSNRTLVDCRRMLIWHAGDHFYAYAGGVSEPISRDIIDSSLIDWDQPHNAAYCEDRYVLSCTYNSLHALLIYEVSTGGWRIRYEDDALDLVGICTDGTDVFGLTSGGDAVHLFETTGAEYGASSTVREVFTQYQVLGPPECDLQVSNAVFIVETDQAGGIDIGLTFRTHGTDATSVDRTLTVDSAKTRYEVNLDLQCDAIKIEATYTGTTPPTVYYMGVPPDQVVAI